jgi:hypothetical protein
MVVDLGDGGEIAAGCAPNCRLVFDGFHSGGV